LGSGAAEKPNQNVGEVKIQRGGEPFDAAKKKKRRILLKLRSRRVSSNKKKKPTGKDEEDDRNERTSSSNHRKREKKKRKAHPKEGPKKEGTIPKTNFKRPEKWPSVKNESQAGQKKKKRRRANLNRKKVSADGDKGGGKKKEPRNEPFLLLTTFDPQGKETNLRGKKNRSRKTANTLETRRPTKKTENQIKKKRDSKRKSRLQIKRDGRLAVRNKKKCKSQAPTKSRGAWTSPYPQN